MSHFITINNYLKLIVFGFVLTIKVTFQKGYFIEGLIFQENYIYQSEQVIKLIKIVI